MLNRVSADRPGTQALVLIVEVKLPTAHLDLEEARMVYEKQHIPRDTLTEGARHVLQSAFNGRRIVIFLGGAKTDDAAILDGISAS